MDGSLGRLETAQREGPGSAHGAMGELDQRGVVHVRNLRLGPVRPRACGIDRIAEDTAGRGGRCGQRLLSSSGEGGINDCAERPGNAAGAAGASGRREPDRPQEGSGCHDVEE